MPAMIKKLDQLVDQSQTVLFRTRTVFPFTLFPTEVIIDEVKVNIVRLVFFSSAEVYSLEIRNLNTVSVETSPFFATLILTERFIQNEMTRVKFLKKAAALKAREILQGLIIANQQEVNLPHENSKGVKRKMSQLGTISLETT